MNQRFKRKVAENLRHPKGFFGRLIGSFMNHFNKGIIEFTLANIPEIENGCIAEVGIGSGKALQLCSRRFPNAMIYGFDISETMLSVARRRNWKSLNKAKLKIEKAPISNIPLENESLETLFTINTLYFWEDPNQVFKEVRRLLKKDGYFIISFNPKEAMNPSTYPDDLFQFYTADHVGELAMRNQFKLLSSFDYQDRYENYVCMILKK